MNTQLEAQNEKPYWKQRVDGLGLTEEQNTVKVWMPGSKEPQVKKLLYFDDKKKDNLTILYLDLKKKDDAYVAATYKNKVIHESGVEEIIDDVYVNTRLKKPIGKNKYRLPAGAPALPYLTRKVIDACNAPTKQVIPVLVLVEGSLKAEKASMHDVYAIGINGIFGTRDKDKQGLHKVILEVMNKCTVQNLVYLQDNDARHVKVEYGIDLGERPLNFAHAVNAFRKACKYATHKPNCFYAHVSEALEEKGLDDVLIANKGKENEVVEDLFSLTDASKFFVIKDLSRDLKDFNRIKDYFNLSSPEKFYHTYSDLIGGDTYKFLGDQYRYDDDKDELELLVPGLVNDYVLVGNNYIKSYYTVNSRGSYELERDIRQKAIIENDFQRADPALDKAAINKLLLKIPKYEGFINEPNFIEYSPEVVINERTKLLNLAFPIPHKPEDGEWPHIKSFLEHIFYNDGDSKYEVGLDMIQMYYTNPCQQQRILCLVSKENETGKSTFLQFLRNIFGQNMSIIGALELANQFNGYVTKTLVGIDESKIENPQTVEMIKSLVTNPYANFNEKNISAKPVVNRVKLIMTTNHIFNFVNIAKEENKWFILEVGKLKNKDKDLMDKMLEEIPAFLHFLRNRELKHFTTKSRFAIPDEVIQTEALRRVKENSKPALLGMIADYVKDRFEMFPEKGDVFVMDPSRLYEALFPEKNFKYTSWDIAKVLKQEMGMEPGKSTYYYYPIWNLKLEAELPDEDGVLPEPEPEWKRATGRVYTFHKKDWIN